MIRRAIGTTLVGLCAFAGPLAAPALADATPALTASTTNLRPGIPFTVTSDTGCGSSDNGQSVNFSFTDSAGTSFEIGSVDTDEDGTWSDATVVLPVDGVDDSGAWDSNQEAAGPGTIDATCTQADDSGGDPGDDSVADDDSGDPVSYASLPVTLTGDAPQLSLSPAVSTGGSVTVTPAEGCAGAAVADVDISVVDLHPADDPGDDTPGDDPGNDDDTGALPSASVSTAADGTWAPVTLALPDAVATGDYAVIATCSIDSVLSSSYDAAPLAVGTVTLGKAVCTAKGATVAASGSYSGDIAGQSEDDDNVTLPTKVKLTGDGPWTVELDSATTGQRLAVQTVTCARPMYDLGVSKTGVSAKGVLQTRVCDTGRSAATAVLQLGLGKHAQTVDRQALDPGDCSWLTGGKMRPGSTVKGQVLIDPPGKGSTDTDVQQTFTVHRRKH